MSNPDSGETLSETIVIVDMVGSTSQAFWLGWEQAGRPILKGLRASIEALQGDEFGLACRKFTGDGYMLTFNRGNRSGKFASLPLAFGAMGVLSRYIEKWNQDNDPLTIKLRFAVHFGGVEKHFDNDREGLDVAYAFRLEGVDSIKDAWGTDSQVTVLPENDYAILSDKVVQILEAQKTKLPWLSLGSLPIKSFGRHEVFLLDKISELDRNALIQGSG